MRSFPVLLNVVAFALIILMVGACGGGSSLSDNGNLDQVQLYGKQDLGKDVSAVPPADPEPDWTWDLIAGQHMYVGTVSVWNDATTIYVVYTLFDGYMMTEAHALASATMPGPKDGNPGRFTAKMEFDEPVSGYTFEIPLASVAGLEDKDDLYIAAHATLTDGETLWGGYWDDEAGSGTWDFPWKKWGGGFATNVMPSYVMPADPVTYWARHYGPVSYWGVNFVGDPTFDFPGSNEWIGWCADKYHTMYPNRNYDVMIYSTYDLPVPTTTLEERMLSDNWDLINYMINMRHHGLAPFDLNWSVNTNKEIFQDAIWYFKDGVSPAHSAAWNLINDAAANGENYIPGAGDWFALILYPEGGTQMNIIEVDP